MNVALPLSTPVATGNGERDATRRAHFDTLYAQTNPRQLRSEIYTGATRLWDNARIPLIAVD